MRPYLTPFTRILALLFVAGCASDTQDDLIPIEPDPPALITYATHMRPIMSNSCVSCHSDPTTNGAPNALTTYTQVRFAVENENLIQRMNNESAPMPPAGLLPKTTRDLVQQWLDDGFQE